MTTIREEWTEERTQLLIKLKTEGKMARGEIADHINFQTGSAFTRSAIGGKVDRLFPTAKPKRTPAERAEIKRAYRDRYNSERRAARVAAGAPTRTPKRPELHGIAPPLKVVFRAEEVAVVRVHGVANLEDHHCRFMVNDDCASPIYCGGHVVDGKSWCFHHCAVVFAPPVVRVRSAA